MGFYVYKNGRCLSDFDNYIDARKMADEIGGELAGELTEDLIEKIPSVIEEINNLKWEYWHRCANDNYPECKDDSTFIAYKYEDGKWHYWTYDNCPYDWNVLCRGEGYWKTIKSPEDEM